MKAANKRRSETAAQQEFQHSLQLVNTITSWHLWCGVLTLALLPATIILLSFHALNTNLLVFGILGLLWVVTAFTLVRQRRRLAMLREGLIGQIDGATKSHVRAEKFYGLSILDPLTGLYNRRFGETRLEEEIARVEESEDPLLVLAFDFDRFKQINDNYGHAAGDLALKEFSRRLQRAIRACDVPIRVGGDEFLLILPECPQDKVELIFSRMGSIVFSVNGQKISLSFSHGMAQYQVGDTPETLIKRADERLYAAKANRKSTAGVEQAATTISVTQKVDSKSSSDEPLGSRRAAGLNSGRVRQDGRVPKEVAIFLIGSDLDGTVFSEQTNTVEIGRHGAGVVSRHKLAPEQEIIIRCLDTNKEAEARVVCVMGSESEGHTYAVAFVSPTANIWGVELPPLSESEKEASHFLFECTGCNGRKTFDDSDLESDDYTAGTAVIQFCEHCESAMTWKRVLTEPITLAPGV